MYSSFVNYLDSIDKLDKNFYEEIKNVFGEDTDMFFEEYILSIDENDVSIYDKVEYYIRIKSTKFDVSDVSKTLDPNLALYLNQIGKYPKLDQNEEMKIITKIKKLEEELRFCRIDDMYLDCVMNKYEFNRKIGHNLESRKIQLKYLNQIDNIDNNDLFIFQKYVDYMNSKEYFFNCNLKLVVFLAKLRSYNESNLLDSIQNGNIGLMHAINNYDLSKETKFSTYASFWINNKMIRKFKHSNSTLKVPYYILELVKSYKNYKDLFYSSNGVYPSYDECFDFFYKKMKDRNVYQNETEMKRNKIINELMNQIDNIINSESVISLNSSLSFGDDDEIELIDLVTDDSVNIESSLNKSLIYEGLQNVFKKLSNRKICILLLRNGIRISKYLSFKDTKEVFSNLTNDEVFRIWNGKYYLTQKEISSLLSITRERVRQLESKGMEMIKQYGKKFVDYIK